MTSVTLEEILSSPNYFVYDFNDKSSCFLFKGMDRGGYLESTFLDTRIKRPVGSMDYVVQLKDVVSALKNSEQMTPSSRYIFHTSFCCSTLLARCFEVLHNSLVLKEPWILRTLADLKRQKPAFSDMTAVRWREIIAVTTQQLNKSYNKQQVVIKPTNVANNLINDIMVDNSGAKAVVLYNTLEDFLISNLKKNPETQMKMPLLARIFAHDVGGLEQIDLQQLEKLPFLYSCVVIWFMQIKLIQQQLSPQFKDRYVFINSSDFLSDPADTVSKLNDFYCFPELDSQDYLKLEAVLNKNAKDTGVIYSAEIKKQEKEFVANHYKVELMAARKWAEDNFQESSATSFLEQVKHLK